MNWKFGKDGVLYKLKSFDLLLVVQNFTNSGKLWFNS